MTTICGYYWCDAPHSLRTQAKTFANKLGSIEVALPIVECQDLESILWAMRGAIPRLHNVACRELLDVFERSFDDWLDADFAYRRMALRSLSVTLGYSLPMINAILDALFSRMKDDLRGLESTELREGITVCTHPATPGPQALAIVSSLLKGMPIFCKAQPTEPTFTSLYMQSLAQLEPGLAQSLVTIPWEGGTLGTKPLDQILYGGLGAQDALAFFGSSNALTSIRRFTSPQLPIYAYTKNVGAVVIGKEMLSNSIRQDTVSKCAYAVSAFNRSTCVSPQLIFVEQGGDVSSEEFCEDLSAALAHIAANELPVGDLGAMYGRFANANMAYEMLDSQGLVKYFPFSDGVRLVGAVIYIPRGIPELPEGGNVRTVTVCPVGDVFETTSLLNGRIGDVHSVGMALSRTRYESLNHYYQQQGIRVSPIEDMLNLSFRDYALFS